MLLLTKLSETLQSQKKKLLAKEPTTALFLDKPILSNISFGYGWLAQSRIHTAIEGWTKVLPASQPKTDFEGALESGDSIVNSIEKLLSAHNGNLSAIKKHADEYWAKRASPLALSNWIPFWYAKSDQVIDSCSDEFFIETRLAVLNDIFDAMKSKLEANSNLSDKQITAYIEGLDKVFNTCNNTALSRQIPEAAALKFHALSKEIAVLRESALRKLLEKMADTAVSQAQAANSTVSKKLDEADAKITQLKDEAENIKNRAANQEFYTRQLEAALKKQNNEEYEKIKSIYASKIYIDQQIALARKALEMDPAQENFNKTPEYIAFFDVIDSTSKSPSRNGGKLLNQHMLNCNQAPNKYRKIIREEFKERIDNIEQQMKAQKNSQQGAQKNLLLNKILFVVSGLVRMSGLSNWERLFATKSEEHEREFFSLANQFKIASSQNKNVPKMLLPRTCHIIHSNYPEWTTKQKERVQIDSSITTTKKSTSKRQQTANQTANKNIPKPNTVATALSDRGLLKAPPTNTFSENKRAITNQANIVVNGLTPNKK